MKRRVTKSPAPPQPDPRALAAKRLKHQNDRTLNLARRLEKAANRLERHEERLKAQLARTPRELPADFDDEIKTTIEQVRPFTMTSPEKLHGLITAVRYIEDAKIKGAVVECGVWRGGSMHAVARTLDNLGRHDRDLYLFDTFAGMTQPTERDQSLGRASAAQLLGSHDKTAMVWAVASYEDVKAGLEEVPYPAERFHLVEGTVEETIPGAAPEQIALLRLDTDWYESTRHELKHLFSRLEPGGVLIIDDYGTWQGAKEATDEFFATLEVPMLMLRAGRSRVGVKPAR